MYVARREAERTQTSIGVAHEQPRRSGLTQNAVVPSGMQKSAWSRYIGSYLMMLRRPWCKGSVQSGSSGQTAVQSAVQCARTLPTQAGARSQRETPGKQPWSPPECTETRPHETVSSSSQGQPSRPALQFLGSDARGAGVGVVVVSAGGGAAVRGSLAPEGWSSPPEATQASKAMVAPRSTARTVPRLWTTSDHAFDDTGVLSAAGRTAARDSIATVAPVRADPRRTELNRLNFSGFACAHPTATACAHRQPEQKSSVLDSATDKIAASRERPTASSARRGSHGALAEAPCSMLSASSLSSA